LENPGASATGVVAVECVQPVNGRASGRDNARLSMRRFIDILLYWRMVNGVNGQMIERFQLCSMVISQGWFALRIFPCNMVFPLLKPVIRLPVEPTKRVPHYFFGSTTVSVEVVVTGGIDAVLITDVSVVTVPGGMSAGSRFVTSFPVKRVEAIASIPATVPVADTSMAIRRLGSFREAAKRYILIPDTTSKRKNAIVLGFISITCLS
jgi:hypothetical protein